jgi:PHD/YefM family antitoxin component YafN of YafNO toxin-antitoxin module
MTTLHPQFLTDPDGTRRAVVLPVSEFEALVSQLEDLEDIQAAETSLREIEAGARPLSLESLDEYLKDAMDR